jgi:hypothetical protein
VDSSLSLGVAGTGIDVTVDGEDALGLDDTVVSPRVEGFCRIARRHRIDFAWYDLSRDSKRTLQDDIGDEYPIGTTIKTDFDLQILRASYAYSVYKDEHFDLGISAGIFGIDLDFQINATDIGKDQTDFTFPLPVLGLRGNFAITDKWFIRQGMDFFFVKVDDFEGHIFDVYAALEYNFWKYAGIGVGFDYVIADVEKTDEEFLD